MGVAGNHEIEEDAQQNRFQAFETRYRYPFEESGSDSPQYYSFDAAGARPDARRATGECSAVLLRGAHDGQGKRGGAKLRVRPVNSSVLPMRCVHTATHCGVQRTPCRQLRLLRLLFMPFSSFCGIGVCRPACMHIARTSPCPLASANDVASRLVAHPAKG